MRATRRWCCSVLPLRQAASIRNDSLQENKKVFLFHGCGPAKKVPDDAGNPCEVAQEQRLPNRGEISTSYFFARRAMHSVDSLVFVFVRALSLCVEGGRGWMHVRRVRSGIVRPRPDRPKDATGPGPDRVALDDSDRSVWQETGIPHARTSTAGLEIGTAGDELPQSWPALVLEPE